MEKINVGDKVTVQPREATINGKVKEYVAGTGRAIVETTDGRCTVVCSGDLEKVPAADHVRFSIRTTSDGRIIHTTELPSGDEDDCYVYLSNDEGSGAHPTHYKLTTSIYGSLDETVNPTSYQVLVALATTLGYKLVEDKTVRD